MRTINEIIVHCTATPEGRHVTTEQVDKWHKQRGFAGIGYHYLIYLDGSVHEGRPIERAGAHCKGHNAHSIGVCYVGGTDAKGKGKDTRTDAQKESLCKLLMQLVIKYPDASIHGHYEYAAKSCPCFNVAEEYKMI